MNKYLSLAKAFLQHHDTAILSGMAVVGVGTTTYFAVRNTVVAHKQLQALEADSGIYINDMPFEMKAKTVWKTYIPTAISGASTIALIIGACVAGQRKAAALAGAYGLLQESYREYRTNVVETQGQEFDRDAYQKAVAKVEEAQETRKVNSTVFENGIACFDPYSGRYFEATKEDIRRAINDVNREIIHQSAVSLNGFYSSLDIPENDLGSQLGWGVGTDLDVEFYSHLRADGTPCLAFNFTTEPYANWWRLSN